MDRASTPGSEPGRDWLVIRFRPVDLQATIKRAEREQRRAEHAGLSVFATRIETGETEATAAMRLIAVANMAGIDPERNREYFPTAAGTIYDAGFIFRKDGEDGEPVEHWCVDVGTPDEQQVGTFLGCFGNGRAVEGE